MCAPVRLKVCCISSIDEARLAVSAGADALGLVSRMPSGPGVIPEALIAEIAASVPPPVATFLLTSKTRADSIAAQHARCRTTAIQLVDTVPAAQLRQLRTLLPSTKLVQVIHVQGTVSIEEAVAAAPWVDALLLDSGNPTLPVKQLGGTGRVHDWQLSARITASVPKPVFLAGGLTAENVRTALSSVRPFGLDICSGVRENGALSQAKLRAFVRAARGGGDAFAAKDATAPGPGR
jgi:phosphoribosylanthranilate isomerase